MGEISVPSKGTTKHCPRLLISLIQNRRLIDTVNKSEICGSLPILVTQRCYGLRNTRKIATIGLAKQSKRGEALKNPSVGLSPPVPLAANRML